MITLLDKPPEHLRYCEAFGPHKYVELRDKDGRVFGHAVFKITGVMASFHLKPLRWSHNIFRCILDEWPALKALIKSNGAKMIFVRYNDIGDARMYKLLCACGFQEPRYEAVTGLEL